MGEGLESVKVSWDGGLIRVLPLCALGGGGGGSGPEEEPGRCLCAVHTEWGWAQQFRVSNLIVLG